MIEPPRLASIRRRATACAMKKAARTLSAKMTSKSSTLTSISAAGRLVPALLTRTSNGCAAMIARRTASRSVTSSWSASALSPRATIACAAASISSRVRAASVTCAPACASADAAASPMPRPPPVTATEGRRFGEVDHHAPMSCTVMPARQSLVGGTREEKQVAIGVLDDEGLGTPGLLPQSLKEDDACRLKFQEQLLDRCVRIDTHVG